MTLGAISGGAELIHSEMDGDHRYRLARTESGFLVTARSRDAIGATVVAEWLHRTEEAGQACFEAVVAANAAFRAINSGLPAGAALSRYEKLAAVHTDVCAGLNDDPLIGQEVRQLREELFPE